MTTVVTFVPYLICSCFLASIASICRTRPGSPSPMRTMPPGPTTRWTMSSWRFAVMTGDLTQSLLSMLMATSAEPFWPSYRL